MGPRLLSLTEARALLLGATHMGRPAFAGALDALGALGAVQLDPIDRIGVNADLVLHARVQGYRKGDWARTMPGGAFEHFAKERCLLPARLFPFYRDQAVETPWWLGTVRQSRVDPGLVAAVLDEVKERGPIRAQALSDHGRVQPLDWSGWKGTAKAGTMALEVLWTDCRVVTAGRDENGHRLYDIPARALPTVHEAPGGDFFRQALLDRVASAGLLRTASGPQWSMLSPIRGGPVVEALVAEGALERVRVMGSRREYLCLPGVAGVGELDEEMRVVGPLDALIWDRELVGQVFDFEYVWEIYKPEGERRWGYYVVPLLHRGRLVGRFEGKRRVGGGIEVIGRWGDFEEGAFEAALGGLAEMLGV